MRPLLKKNSLLPSKQTSRVSMVLGILLAAASGTSLLAQVPAAVPKTEPQSVKKTSGNAPAGLPSPEIGVPQTAIGAPAVPPISPALVETGRNSLTIRANNASLRQTLQRVAEKTGMKVNGVSGDEHVFGNFGPGNPRDVLNALLDGTAYNVIMKGALDNGAPRELLLSARSSGAGGQPVPASSAITDDSAADDLAPDDDSNQVPPNADPGLRPSILPADPAPPAPASTAPDPGPPPQVP